MTPVSPRKPSGGRGRRAAENPLAHLSGGNAKIDRRPLSADELLRLVGAAAASGATFRGLTGPDRAVLYSVAAATGFRAGELASLTPAAFELAGNPPTITLAAEHAKNGKPAVQLPPPELTGPLTDYFRGRPIGQPVWAGTWSGMAAGMIRIDLDTAGIATARGTPRSARSGTYPSRCSTGPGRL